MAPDKLVWVRCSNTSEECQPAILLGPDSDQDDMVLIRWSSTNMRAVVPKDFVKEGELTPRKRSAPEILNPSHKKHHAPKSRGNKKSASASWGAPAKIAAKGKLKDPPQGSSPPVASLNNTGWSMPSPVAPATAALTAPSQFPRNGWGMTSQGTAATAVSPSPVSRSGWGMTSHTSTIARSPSQEWGTSNILTTEKIPGGSGWGSMLSVTNGWGSGFSSSEHQSGGCWGTSAKSTSISALSFPTAAKNSGRKTVVSAYAVCSTGTPIIYRQCREESFLTWLWGDRVIVDEVGISEAQSIPPHMRHFNTLDCSIIVSKFEKPAEKGGPKRSKSFETPYVKAYYLIEAGPNLEPIDAQKALNGIANFSELAFTPGKLASRLELLVSPAKKSKDNKLTYMFVLPETCFEEMNVPENKSMGCGFIPESLLEELLGGGTTAKKAAAVQMRAIIPNIGIFKGMLVKKCGISKIQLPQKKVDKSTATKKTFKGAFMLFNAVHPWDSHESMGRLINPNLKDPGESKMNNGGGLSSMLKQLMLGCGIGKETVDSYESESKYLLGRHHAHLWGVCDCTNDGLPEGSVFITGFGIGRNAKREVFVTRFPCTEKADAKILQIVTTKPPDMTDEDWNFICSMQFGLIMFASPRDPDAMSLPEQIANGDLDGDSYFVCWDEAILSSIPRNECHSVYQQEKSANAQDVLEDSDDELPGTNIPGVFDGNDGVVVRKTANGKYLVKNGIQEREMTKEEIMRQNGNGENELAMVKRIIGHKGTGRRVVVKVQWSDDSKTEKKLSYLRGEISHELAEYALRKSLLDEPGWAWAKQYVRDAEAVGIKGHRHEGKSIQVEVMYDDGYSQWETAKDIDVEILASYAAEADLDLEDKEWKWLSHLIKQAKKEWFTTVQKCLGDIKNMAEYSRFIEALYRAHKKRNNINNEDAIQLGRAYKYGLDIGKHGGRVRLAAALRDDIVSKTSTYADKFLEIE